MLRHLSISNFAVIDKLELEFAPGFNVFTGETGAGKSVIIDAIGLLVGGRADSTWVRTGQDRTQVQGVLLVPENAIGQVNDILGEYGLETQGDELILAREINREGRNLCRVNGRIVPMKLLALLGEHFIDIHSQGQHLSLFRVREHVDILDRYAGLMTKRLEVGGLVGKLNGTRAELKKLKETERDLAHRTDLLSFQVEEVNSACLQSGEDEQLVQDRNRAEGSERLLSLVKQVSDSLSGDDDAGSALDILRGSYEKMIHLESLEPSFKTAREVVESAIYQLEGILLSLREYSDSIEHAPDSLEAIEARLTQIFQLKRKYGDSIADILNFSESAASELDELSRRDIRIGELEEEEKRLLGSLGHLAGALSDARGAAVEQLISATESGLQELALGGARIGVVLQRKEISDGVSVGVNDGANYAFDATGIDHVEFVFSANSGEDLKPLVRIASGGEGSRLMLAIKAMLSSSDRVPVLVFDEIDAGVGGRVGVEVGRKLWRISREHQVLCVTHLPQIASFGDRHLRVVKEDPEGSTQVSVFEVSGDERVSELNDMLGAIGEASASNAREILVQTEAWKTGSIC